jgi:hypothetical protein
VLAADSSWSLGAKIYSIEIAPLACQFLFKDQSRLRALPAAQERWASSWVRGVSKAFKLKLDLEIPRAFKSPVIGGGIFKSHILRLRACFFIFHGNSFNSNSNSLRLIRELYLLLD